jgi:hypothetical protein
MTAMTAALEELEAEVTRLEDIQEIEDLQRKYGYYFDTRRMKEVLDLFSEQTESVEIESHGQFFGKEGVRRMYMVAVGGEPDSGPGKQAVVQRPPRSPAGFNIITQLQGVVTVAPDGKTAKGRWQTWLCESFPFAGTFGQYWLHGYYENEFIKEDGKWFFKKLFWNTTFFTRFETGWHVQPLVGFLPMPNPDSPPTAFHPYPSGYHFPYSFAHPVTGEEGITATPLRHPMAT